MNEKPLEQYTFNQLQNYLDRNGHRSKKCTECIWIELSPFGADIEMRCEHPNMNEITFAEMGPKRKIIHNIEVQHIQKFNKNATDCKDYKYHEED